MKFYEKIEQEFSNKNVLLLQGPVGWFFYKLANFITKKKKKTIAVFLS